MTKLLSALLSLTIGLSAATEQQPLSIPGEKFDLIEQLKKAEIIPTVLDPFQPFLSVNISWKKASAEIGNTVKVKQVQKIPDVNLLDNLPDVNFNHDDLPQLTLALTDPDARSRDDPDWSEMCHWIVTNISLTPAGMVDFDTMRDAEEIISYQPPGPPPRTGKHRYVFAALSPKNGTHETLHLSKPKERQHWGYGKVRTGLREWAEENGLAVIGANFIYAQDKKQ